MTASPQPSIFPGSLVDQGPDQTRSIGMTKDKVLMVVSSVIINYIIAGSQMHRERDIGTWLE